MFPRLHHTLGVPALLLSATIAPAQDFRLPDLTTSVVASTVPPNGDVNPYGVAVVPKSFGALSAGDILVSNFNNSANLQGTGSTIMDITPSGNATLFATIAPGSTPCPGGVGLTTALAVLPSGWIIVGSLPTTDGTASTAKAGCLLVLDGWGNLAETISGGSINGPWDMAAVESGNQAFLFITNVLNGTVAAGGSVVNEGTVLRLHLSTGATSPVVESATIIGSGFAERTDPAALVIGPTGVALSSDGTLYVADSLNNRIASIPNALTRMASAGPGVTVSSGAPLNDPLGLTLNPAGDILSTNGNNGLLVATTSAGALAGKKLLDDSGTPPGSGALFGLAFTAGGLYYVDDATNTLNILK